VSRLSSRPGSGCDRSTKHADVSSGARQLSADLAHLRHLVARRPTWFGGPPAEPTWFGPDSRCPGLGAVRAEFEKQSIMRSPPMIFSVQQRGTCVQGLRSLATERGWQLRALNVRTNHVHLVVENVADGRRALRDFKAAATRELRRVGLAGPETDVWSRGGSVERLLTPEAEEAACRYVVEGQGEDLGEMPAEEEATGSGAEANSGRPEARKERTEE
jgi:REP element-mobilizing transposase RayT